jgi:PAS domain S-box-containing protein
LRNLDEEAHISKELTRKDDGTDPFSAAVRATRMPMLITDPRQADNPIVFANAAFSRLTGFAEHEILGRNCRFLQGPETDRAAVALVRDAVDAPRPIEVDLLNYRKDGTTFWNRLMVSPVFDDDGALTYFFASQFDVTLEREHLVRLERDRESLETEVAKRDAELLATEQRLKFALKAGGMGFWSLDLATMHLEPSDGCKENFGWPIDEPFTYEDLQAAVHPDDRDKRNQAVAAAIRDGSALDIEYRISTPGGDERWVQVVGQANYRGDGTPLSIVGVSQDITDRKLAEEHRTLLTHELGHLVKNSLATVHAIISQTIRNASSLSEAGKSLEARIQAMAAATNSLVNGDWEGASIRELIERSLAPFGIADGDAFALEGPDVRLPPQMAFSLGLGIHELATNASKYGALSVALGQVQLSWSISPSPQGQVLNLTWRETGGPPVEPPTRKGFGTRLIQRLIASELGGNVDIDYRIEGVVVSASALLRGLPGKAAK